MPNASPDPFAGLLVLWGQRHGLTQEQAYSTLRLMLVKYFEWNRARPGEDFADEVICRILERVRAGEEVHDLGAYAHGVAQHVLQEHWKRHNQGVALPNLPVLPPAARESLFACLDRCLSGALSRGERILILKYYQGDEAEKIRNRKRLAKALGITLNALRLRVMAIRHRLAPCVNRCREADSQ